MIRPPWQRDESLAHGQRVTELWAWCVIDPADDDESVPAMNTSYGWMPMIGADERRVRSLRSFAEATARQVGRPVRLYRFTERTLIETIEP